MAKGAAKDGTCALVPASQVCRSSQDQYDPAEVCDGLQASCPDDVSGVETTGHEWDGISELDNPLPRWWLWIFYGCVVWSIGYWVVMPAWPLLTDYTRGIWGHSQRQQVVADLDALKASRGAIGEKLTSMTLEQIEADPTAQQAALAWGKSAFGDNCATCHGAGGGGAKGYPNLNAYAWWGIYAPAGLPKPILDKFHAEVVKAFRAPDVIQLMQDQLGMQLVLNSPEEMQKFVSGEMTRWSKTIKDNGIKLD